MTRLPAPLRPLAAAAVLVAGCLLAGCAGRSTPVDYTAFIAARPASLLVMPPINNTPDVKATAAVWAHAARPLAEAGYYVIPAAAVEGMLRQNGVDSPHDAAGIPVAKLHEVFGADAAVYITIASYGTTYAVIDSQTRVEVAARIVDLRSGALLWQGRAAAASSSSGSSSGLTGMLVSALVSQVANTVADRSFEVAGDADRYLLGHGQRDGILAGPRRPQPEAKPAP